MKTGQGLLDWFTKKEEESQTKRTYAAMMSDYLETQVDRMNERNQARLSEGTFFLQQDQIRKRLLSSLGLNPLPPRTPLHARCVGKIDQEEYVIERIIFEPRPHFLTPAHLYLPRHRPFPRPAILYAVGHWMREGKMEPENVQKCCISFVRCGFVVLVYDPIGQGERGASFLDHGHRDLLLLGYSQAGMMVWESIRALDYLMSRDEVDGNRIGMTGASGGGLNTLYTSAVDPRITATAPVCYVTSFPRFLRAMRGMDWNGGIDLCNQVPGVIAYAGMEGTCALIAPRALCIINAIEDPQFPVEGAEEVVRAVSPVFEHLGVKDRLSFFAVPSGHGYSEPAQRVACQFFQKWLSEDGDTAFEDRMGHFKVFAHQDGQWECFPWRQTVSSGPVLYEFSRRELTRWQNIRKRYSSDITQLRDFAKKQLISLLNLNIHSLAPRLLSCEQKKDEFWGEKVLLETEPGITVPLYLISPLSGVTPPKEAVVIDDRGKFYGLLEGVSTSLLQAGFRCITFDVRGTGETVPRPPAYRTVATLEGTLAQVASGPEDTLEFEIATNALMMDSSLVAQQVFDVLSVLSWFFSYTQLPENDFRKIGVVASGPRSCFIALLASLLTERIGWLALHNPLCDFASGVGKAETDIPMGMYIFGFLRYFDLPDLMTLLVPRPLLVNAPLNAFRETIPPEEANDIYGPTQEAYRKVGKETHFVLEHHPSFSELLSRRVSLFDLTPNTEVPQ